MPIFKMKPKVGPHHFNGEWIKPGDTINCEFEEIESVIDKFEEVRKAVESPDASEAEDAKQPVVEEQEIQIEEEAGQVTDTGKLEVIHKGRGKYDVVNTASGKVINDKPLTKKEAYEFIEVS